MSGDWVDSKENVEISIVLMPAGPMIEIDTPMGGYATSRIRYPLDAARAYAADLDTAIRAAEAIVGNFGEGQS